MKNRTKLLFPYSPMARIFVANVKSTLLAVRVKPVLWGCYFLLKEVNNMRAYIFIAVKGP